MSKTNHNHMAHAILKFPGLARPSNSTSGGGGDRHRTTSSDTGRNYHNNNNNNHQQNHHQNNHHHQNHHYSFEAFNASCDDAWNDKIDDKISFDTQTGNGSGDQISSSSLSSVKTSQNNNNHQKPYGNSKSSIFIKEKSSTSNDNPGVPDSGTAAAVDSESRRQQYDHPKVSKLKKLLYEDDVTDLNQLRQITWNGVNDEDRPLAWKLLLGYVPPVRSKRSTVVENKKREYQNLVAQYYDHRPDNDEMYRQIHIDIPRMQPLITIFQQPVVQGIFERILYIWSIRHPASGYVQGMNDLVTPFFVTYLSEYVPGHSFSGVESFDVSTLSPEIISTIEADSYWSFNKLLDSIQDNYTFAQPGIQRLVNLLEKVVRRVDQKLHEHLERNSVQYLQFAFRWMNNLLIREIPLRCIIRLWDTYLSEGVFTTTTYVPKTGNFPDSSSSTGIPVGGNELSAHNSSMMNASGTPFSSAFHLFVCAAFLRFWSKSLLQEKDFQGLMLRLQNLPTFHWTENEVKLLVADAYMLKCSFSPNHLKL